MAKVKAYDSHYTTGLEDLVLNVNQVAVGNFKPHDLYMIKYEGEVKGPILASDLKSFIEANHDYFTKAEVCRLDLYNKENQKGWGLVYEQALFQRRKPSLIAQEDNDLEVFEDLFVLKNGQKLGPFTFAEINKQLKKHELLFTDFLSFDGGHTWKKMHEIKDLDRRSLEGDHLPAKPKTEILNHFELHQEINDGSLLKDLAALGSNKDKENYNTKIKTVEVAHTEMSSKLPGPETRRKVAYFIASFTFVLLLIWYNSASKTRSVTKQNDEQTEATAKNGPSYKNRQNPNAFSPQNNLNKPALEMNNNSANKRQRPSSIKRRSFRESNAYKQNERKMLDDASVSDGANENYQFDDGNDPVVQDPIRSQLDKETIDPDSDSERAPAAEFEEDVYADGEESNTQDSIDDGEY
jgi:hypothetical protein